MNKKIEKQKGNPRVLDIIRQLNQDPDKERKAKMLSGIRHQGPIDEEEDFFELGMARMKGLLKPETMEVTPAGEEALYGMIEDLLQEMDEEKKAEIAN